ncbi:MAG TPA: PilZ domain-containing protein [Sphingomicrobium sp.]
MDEEEAPEGAGRGDNRAPRVKLSEVAALELPDGRTIGVRISDVSASGFRMETPEPLPLGIEVKLIMRRYDPIPAEIRWSEGLEAGAVFLTSADAF